MTWTPGNARRWEPLVFVPRAVTDQFTAEIVANPRVEVGGKYLGFIRGGPGRYRALGDRRDAISALRFEVTGYLDDGPRAERQGGFHRGDADWQTREFRKLERKYPDLEQLGSWHSHHPNGLRELSGGDVKGYVATVNDVNHNHDFFFVSLGVDLSGFASAKHYLFLRDDPNYYELTSPLIQVTTDPSSPRRPPRRGVSHGSVLSSPPMPNSEPGAVSASDASAPGESAEPAHSETEDAERQGLETDAEQPAGTWEATAERRPSRRRDTTGEHQLPGWSDDPEGRRLLTRERDWLRNPAFAGVHLTVRENRLIATGSMRLDDGSVTVSLLYPSAPNRRDGLLKIATAEPKISLEMPGELSGGLEQATALADEFLRFTRGLGHPGDESSALARFKRRFGWDKP